MSPAEWVDLYGLLAVKHHGPLTPHQLTPIVRLTTGASTVARGRRIDAPLIRRLLADWKRKGLVEPAAPDSSGTGRYALTAAGVREQFRLERRGGLAVAR